MTARLADGTRRARLLARIGRHYQMTSERVRLSPMLELAFTRITDPDRVLDEVAEQEDLRDRLQGKRSEPLHLPYWAELWDSARGLGQWLAGQTIGDISVLDLGCGMGMAGTAAAALGARVMFADLETPALLFAQVNSLPWASRVRTRQVNWQTDHLGEMFDLILGADIVYERKQWDFLEPFWRTHLRPGGEVLLGEPGRLSGDLFVDWVIERGWAVELNEQPVPTRSKAVKILRLTPKQ